MKGKSKDDLWKELKDLLDEEMKAGEKALNMMILQLTYHQLKLMTPEQKSRFLQQIHDSTK